LKSETHKLFGVPIEKIPAGGEAAYYKVVIGPYTIDFVESSTTHRVVWSIQLEGVTSHTGSEKALGEALTAARHRLRHPLQNLATALQNLSNSRDAS